MQYKTIVLELLRERTELYEQLRLTHRLLPTLETCAKELKASHEKLEGDARRRRSRAANRARSRAKPWKWLSRNWRIVYRRHLLRTSRNRSRWTKAMAFVQSHTSNGKGFPTRGQPFRCPARIYPTDTRAPPEPPPAERQNPPQSAKQHIQRRHRQRREGQGPRHHRRHPHAEDRRERAAARDSPEKQTLARFCGFGPVALSIFPDPVTGKYKDAGWQALGEELKRC
jgi:hypothetical protein